MTKSLIKFVQIIYIISSILKAFFFLHPLSCEATLFFFVPFLLPFALFGLNTMLCGKAFETSWTM